MNENSIPDSEVTWLYSLDEYKIRISDGKGSTVYPVTLLPPNLKKFVKAHSQCIDYVHICPAFGSEDYTTCRIYGWERIPSTISCNDADWSTTFNRKKEPPTMDDLQEKIKYISSELQELSTLLLKYKG